MSSNEFDDDVKPLNSPFSRVYLYPRNEQIMNFTICFKHPIDVEAFKRAFSNSIFIKHPRFCSLIVRNANLNGSGVQWKRTHVNIDDHFILHYPNKETKHDANYQEEEEEEAAIINDYLADISVTTPLSEKKPLWEVHVLVGLKCVVLRVHHCIGDGVSMMSLLSACFGQNKDEVVKINKVVVNNGDYISMNDNNHANYHKMWKNMGLRIWVLIKSIWLTCVLGLRLLGRLLGVKDKVGVLSGGDGVELWPRKCVSAKFKIEDFKSIKKAIPNATVNDVLLGMVSHGLSRYVESKKSSKDLKKSRPEFTCMVMVNLRNNPSLLTQEMSDLKKGSSSTRGELTSWGNKTGAFLVPINCCNGLHPLDHVKAMKAIMDNKKQSYEAQLSLFTLNFFAYLGPKVASWCCHKLLCNTSLVISNIMGPSEEISVADNPVSLIKLNVSSLPQAMTIHMVGYAGQAYLQLVVAKDIIPDPEFMIKCFQDSLAEMKNYCMNTK